MPEISPQFELNLIAIAGHLVTQALWVSELNKTNYFAVLQALTTEFLHCVAIKRLNGAPKKIFRHPQTYFLLFPWKANQYAHLSSKHLQANVS